jgi:hypothetical protein
MWFLLRLFLLLSMSCVWSEESAPAKPYIIFLYGARGSGRPVVAVRLKQNFAFPDISIASLISNQILEETPLGQQAREFLPLIVSTEFFLKIFPLLLITFKQCKTASLPRFIS